MTNSRAILPEEGAYSLNRQGYNQRKFHMEYALLSAAKPLLLIVDDDSLICESLGFALAKDFDILTSDSRPHALALLEQLRRPPELALVDLGLPPFPHQPDEGFALISDLLNLCPELKIVVLSGQNDRNNGRHARTLGAVEFVEKPCPPGQLTALLKQALCFAETVRDPLFSGLIGESPPVLRLLLQLGQYANLAFPVLIEGESGSGKDIVASHYLHRLTDRRDAPFLALNCAAISSTLLEPSLFGYAKGAFTGADTAKAGYFEEANGGTLFLDEIGELPLELQPKLLRVLENGEYQRVGETQTRFSRARIITATNRDLRHEVRSGHFRADLFHRLSVFTVAVPPLREMGNDRIRLLNHFRILYAGQSRSPPFTLTSEAKKLWLDYAFPGNTRELRNIVIRLTAHYAGQDVSPEQLLAEFDSTDIDTVITPGNGLAAEDIEHARQSALRHLQTSGQLKLDATLELWERGYIEAAVQLCGGNLSQAARLLGINRTTLYNRMEGWGRR